MPRLHVIKPEEAIGSAKEIYGEVTKRMGKVVNIFQGMANSPAALRAYLAMSAALSEGELSPQDREAIYLAVSESNGCQYCVSAHSILGKRAGMTDQSVLAARRFHSTDGRQQALLTFIRKVIDTKGYVTDDDLAAVRRSGYSDGQIVEAIGYIALATYSNFFNHVHDTKIDFPIAQAL
ncbi:MAG: peroxidase-related enzyme [Planctomycetia bacterium]|nr:peroxidase-related enzyme [Planctomycetia bacterium]